MLGIYCRISREKLEGTDRSIKEQQLRGIEIAEDNNLSHKIYIDEGISGTLDIDKRPALMQMVEDIVEGKITSVFVYDQSRLERSPQTRMILGKLFKDNDITIYTTDGKVGKEIEDEFLGDMLSVINNFYTKITSKKIKAVIRRNLAEGKLHGATPYGYNKGNNNDLVVNKKEAEIVKRIYNESLLNVGVNKIAKGLNDDRIKTKRGNYSWQGSSIRTVLINSIYCGVRNTSQGSFDAPAILDKEYWNKVKNNLSNNTKWSGPTVKKERLLRTILICGECGKNYYATSTQKTRVQRDYYNCAGHRNKSCTNKAIRQDVVDAFVWDRFFKEKVLLDITKEHFKETNHSKVIKDIDKSMVEVANRIKKNEEAKERIINLVIEGVIEKKDVLTKMEALNSIIKDTQERSKELLFEKNKLAKMSTDGRSEVAKVRRIKTEVTHKQKVKLIAKYIDSIKVTFNKGLFRLEFAYTFMSNTDAFYIDKVYSAAYSQRYRGSHYYNLKDSNESIDYTKIFKSIITPIETL
tara:strand:+ start:268 stop:1833 length:1566 start_codon:yes stop_codon:yes gene_type:complete